MNTGNFTTEMGTTSQGLNETEAPLNGKKVKKDKKKKRKDKHKNKGDDVQSIGMGPTPGAPDENVPVDEDEED